MRRCVVLLVTALALAVCLAACGSPKGPVDGPGGLFAVERGPANSVTPVVLFLHGASFTSKVWQETGIANDLAEAGIASVAVDLPGYGETPATDASPATVLANVIAAVDRGHGVVVVSPSMSGSFSLPLLASGPPAELVGFVPVAPVGINEFVAAVDTPVALPTLIVWGESDDVINPRQAKLLAKQFSNSEVMMIRGGGHAAYRDEPKRFSTALIEFVNGLPPS